MKKPNLIPNVKLLSSMLYGLLGFVTQVVLFLVIVFGVNAAVYVLACQLWHGFC